MWGKFITTANITRCPAILAATTAVLSLAGCAGVLWADSTAYADLSNGRLQQSVGVKGMCCAPGLKTTASSGGVFGCSSTGVVCNVGASSTDTCAGASCDDSDNSEDQCDSSEFLNESVSVSVCTVVSSAAVPCGTGGSRCAYVTDSSTVGFAGCGTSDICTSTSGVTCQ